MTMTFAPRDPRSPRYAAYMAADAARSAGWRAAADLRGIERTAAYRAADAEHGRAMDAADDAHFGEPPCTIAYGAAPCTRSPCDCGLWIGDAS